MRYICRKKNDMTMKNWKERKQIIVDLMKNEFYVPMKEKEDLWTQVQSKGAAVCQIRERTCLKVEVVLPRRVLTDGIAGI